MEVQLTPDQKAFIRPAIEIGRVQRKKKRCSKPWPFGKNKNAGGREYWLRLVWLKLLWRVGKAKPLRHTIKSRTSLPM